MRKIGLIIDSASGYTLAEANAKGHAFIPLQITINENTKKAGIEISQEDLYKEMANKKNVEIRTSLPNGKDIEAAFEWILERYEKAIYVGLSYKLSGTQNAVYNVWNSNDEYKERIFIYRSEYSSPWLNLYIEDFEKVLEEEEDFEKISEIFDLANPHMFGLVAPGDIYWFYKGGRISKGAYMAGSLLKVIPILTLEDGKLDPNKVVKARGIEKAMDKMNNIVEEKIEILKKLEIPFKILNMDSNVSSYTETMAEKIEEKFNVPKNELINKSISTEQTAHMGPGSCGIGIYVKLEDLLKKKGLK